MGHSIGISGLKTGSVESLKKGQDLEDWTAHPHQKFPGILPEGKRIPLIQTKPDTNRTTKERTLPFVLLVFVAV